jgi:hypothetical protein
MLHVSKILFDRNAISKETKHIVDLQNCMRDCLTHDKEMYSSSKLLKMLSEADYFKENDEFSWPDNFKPLLSDRKYFHSFF